VKNLLSGMRCVGPVGLLLLSAGCSGTSGDGEDVQANALALLSAPTLNVDGLTATNQPPDTIGEVGPNHYVQAVNATEFGIWDKAGTQIGGPVSLGSLWSSGPCATDFTDPTVNYDQLADRWVITQMSSSLLGVCIAVSRTPTPGTTAADYYLYELVTPRLPDYQKIGVWSDAYYMTAYDLEDPLPPELGLYALDRAALLAGTAPSTITCATSGSQCLRSTIPALGGFGQRTRALPADLEGATPPPVGTPGLFLTTVDDLQDPSDPSHRIEIYPATVNWTAQTLTIGAPTILAPDPFDIMICNRNGLGFRDCIPQPGMGSITLDALSNLLMMGLRYRQFGGHASLVFNQTVNVAPLFPGIATGEVAGIRWYELRNMGAGWTIFDQGDFSPQNSPGDDSELVHRWMASMAQDRDGNLALGYTVVNSDNDPGEELYPAMAYTGRLTTDAPGTLEPETLVEESAGPSSSNRWGDYSAMSVDPVDDCTFWYTSNLVDGETRIVSFKHEGCGCNDATYEAESMFHSAGNAAPPDGWNLHSNGYISTTHDFTAGPATLTVRALGQSAAGVAPHMVVRVGGVVIGDVFVSPTTYTDFPFTFLASGGPQEVRITFDNDLFQPPQDRNLWLDKVTVECADEVPANPCAGLCENPQVFSWSGSYQSGNLGTGAICRETTQPLTGGNCGNMAAGRQLLVNGTAQVCNGANWATPPAPRNGGYCVQATPGNYAWAFFTLW